MTLRWQAIRRAQARLNASGKRSFGQSLTRPTSRSTCGASARGRTTSARPTTKTTPSGCSPDSRSGDWDAHIETFDVLFPTPKERVLEMVEPTKFTAKSQEPPSPVDPTSNQKSEQLPTYNAYSIDGDVTAPLVFVNYGLPEDYEKLDRLGISVKGAIVIAKYGESWRGIKPKVAAEHGAIGCLIYSDPKDDGYFADEAFRQGPMRNQGRRAARQRDGHAAVSRRSAHSGRRRDCRTPSACRSKTPDDRRRFRCCRFHTAMRSRCSRRSRDRWHRTNGAAAADHLSRRPGPAQSPPEGGVQLGHQAGVRRHRENPRHRSSPTNG